MIEKVQVSILTKKRNLFSSVVMPEAGSKVMKA